VAQKVIQYQESSLNRIKSVTEARFFINLDYKMRTRILYVCIKYSMCDNLWRHQLLCLKLLYRQ